MAKKKAAKQPSKGVQVMGSADDPRQTYLDDEAAPSRIKNVDAAIEAYEDALGTAKLARERLEDLRGKLVVAFEEADVQQYRFGGRVYFLEDGGVMVKRRKAKEK